MYSEHNEHTEHAEHLAQAGSAASPSAKRFRTLMKSAEKAMRSRTKVEPGLPLRVGVDLGTAYTVIMVTDAGGRPLAGATRFADVVRDGVVWDFAGAQRVVGEVKAEVERRIGRPLTHAAVTIPPAVTTSDHRAHRYVIESVGLECTDVVDEPAAANSVLKITDGAVVDVGGGTTGIAILSGGEVIATDDEPTGGKHLTLVLAGALGIPIEEAESAKQDPANHAAFLPIVRPTLEKIATIVQRQIAGHDVRRIHLVGGTASFTGIAAVVGDITGVPTEVAASPLLVTPLGAASFDAGGAADSGREAAIRAFTANHRGGTR